jgi:hypothetical protein
LSPCPETSPAPSGVIASAVPRRSLLLHRTGPTVVRAGAPVFGVIVNIITTPSLLAELQHNAAASPEQRQHLLFEFNKQVLLEALRLLGAKEVVATYAGSGDEGQIDEVGLQPTTLDAAQVQVQPAAERTTWDATTRTHQTDLLLDTVDLHTALCDFLDAALVVVGHDGYENGDGGQGTLTIDVGSGSVTLEHTDFYTESDTSTHEL